MSTPELDDIIQKAVRWFAQTVRAVIFVISIFMVIFGVVSFFVDTGFDTQEAIFSVLIFGLLAFVTGGSFRRVRKHGEGRGGG